MKTLGLIIILIGVVYFINGINAERNQQEPQKVVYKVVPQKQFDTVFLENQDKEYSKLFRQDDIWANRR